jgi:putative CocE/NonD family hydrolase
VPAIEGWTSLCVPAVCDIIEHCITDNTGSGIEMGNKNVKKIFLASGVMAAITVVAAFFGNLKWRAVALYLRIPQPMHSVVVERDIMTPISDGVKLASDVYRPAKPGKYPVVLTRTPYGKTNPHHKYAFAGGLFASQGFVFIVQDVRGKFNSEGEFYPYLNEGRDGYETQEWAGTQSWSNGKIGTYGFSYWGSTQWLSAPYQSQYLRAMVPIVTSQDLYARWIYNGIFRLNDVLFWHYANSCRTERTLEDIDIDKAIRTLPLIEADDEMGQDLPSYNDWITHPTPGEYWDQLRVDDKVDCIQAPALMIDGWYDYYLELMLEDYNRMISGGGSPEARQSRLIIGPWTHEAVSKFDDIDFGSQADFMKQIKIILAWYNYWLKNEPNEILKSGPITLFVMGKNEWRSENEWPLARTVFTRYYLHSGGKANTVSGDGALSLQKPLDEPPDQFTYDPQNPVPSIGGTSIYGNAKPGPCDQREIEQRPDVLVYTTPQLEEDVEVTGPIEAIIFASSDAPDTDFSAKLVDVYPDGTAINLRSGMVRARYRESFNEPSLLDEKSIYEFRIPVGATSNLFKKGHCIRMEISSSHFPEFGRNPNTGADNAISAETRKAKQTIHHNAQYPSHITLPIIPPEK